MRSRSACWLLLGALPIASGQGDKPDARFLCTFDQGLVADRAAGRAEPLSATGATLIPGQTGQTLSLRGAQGPAHVAYAADGNFPYSAGCVEFRVCLDWDYRDPTSLTKRMWFDVGGGDNRNRFYLHSLASGLVFGFFDDESTVHAVYGSAITGWRKGEWHRVTCAWDLSRRYLALAVDGVLESDRPSKASVGSWRAVPNKQAVMHIGGFGGLPIPLGGSLDDFRILDAAPGFAAPAEQAAELDPADLRDRQRQASEALARLERAIADAEHAGVEPAYADAVAATGRVGRWRLAQSPIKPSGADVQAWCTYLLDRGAQAEAELQAWTRDRKLEKRVPRPDVFNLHVADDVFRNAADEDVLLVGIRNIEPAEFDELSRFFNLIAWNSGAPEAWIADVKRHGYAGQAHLFWRKPLEAALAEDATMGNVGGWCGHNWTTDLCIEAPRSQRLLDETFTNLRVLRRAPDPGVAYMLLSAEDEYMCWCPASTAMFRAWLRDHYQEIDKLNAVWGVQATSFEELSPPRWSPQGLAPSNRAAWYDWQVFNRARTTAVYAHLRELVRRTWPQVPVCGGTHRQLADNRFGSQGVDPEGLNRGINDVIQSETVYNPPTAGVSWELPAYGLDITAEAMLDFQRSTCAKPATDLEFHAWLRYTEALHAQRAQLPANYTYAVILRHYLHGIRAANAWVWNRSARGSYSPSSFASSPTIPPGSVEELLRAALDVRRLSREIIALSRAPRQVAIMVSDASFMQIHPTFARTHLPSPLVTELDNVCHGSMFLDTPIGFVTERSIAAGALSEYRVVLVPAIDHLDDKTLAALLAFVERGGRMLVTPRSFAFDEHHHPRTSLAGFPQIDGFDFVGLAEAPTAAQLADAEFAERQMINPSDPRVRATTIETTGTAPFAAAGIRLEGAGIRLKLRSEAAQIVARFTDDGAPAIVRITRGAGSIDYCAIPLRPQSFSQLAEALVRESGVVRQVRLRGMDGGPVWGVEARSCQVDGDVLVYAINLLSAPVEFELIGAHPIVAVHDHIAHRPGTTRVRLDGLGTALLRLKTGS